MSKKLVKVTYFRNDESELKTAIITETQYNEIKKVPHLNFVKCEDAPKGSVRSWVLP